MTDGTSTLGEWGGSLFSQQISPNEQRNNLSMLQIYRALTGMSSLAREETLHCKAAPGSNSWGRTERGAEKVHLSQRSESRGKSKALHGGMKAKEDAAELDGLFRSRMRSPLHN